MCVFKIVRMMTGNNLLISRVKILKGGMSNRKFAAMCGLTEGAIRNLLKGGEWDSKTLKSIADGCGKPLWWFFVENDLPQPAPIDVWGDKAEYEQVKGKLDPAVKNELMSQFSELLDTDTIYRSAIIPNVRTFHHGMKEEEKMRQMEQYIKEMDKKMNEKFDMLLEQNRILTERLGLVEDEKKQAGNDH